MKPNRLTVSIEDLQIAIAWLKCNMQDGEREGCLRVVRTLEKI